jgi:hypothetical protein
MLTTQCQDDTISRVCSGCVHVFKSRLDVTKGKALHPEVGTVRRATPFDTETATITARTMFVTAAITT